MTRRVVYRARNATRSSLHIGEIVGDIGDHRAGSRALRFPDSIGKCVCGAEMRTLQIFWQHTNFTGVCLWNHGQKPRRDRNQDHGMPTEHRK